MNICKYCGNVVELGRPCPVCDHVATEDTSVPTRKEEMSLKEIARITSKPKTAATKTTTARTTSTRTTTARATAPRTETPKTTVPKTETPKTTTSSEGTSAGSESSLRFSFPAFLMKLIVTIVFMYGGHVNIQYFRLLSMGTLFSVSGIFKLLLILLNLFLIVLVYILFTMTKTGPADSRLRIHPLRTLFFPFILCAISICGAEIVNGSFLSSPFLIIRALALYQLMSYFMADYDGKHRLVICFVFNLLTLGVCHQMMIERVLGSAFHEIPYFGHSSPFTFIVSAIYVIFIGLMFIGSFGD